LMTRIALSFPAYCAFAALLPWTRSENLPAQLLGLARSS